MSMTYLSDLTHAEWECFQHYPRPCRRVMTHDTMFTLHLEWVQ